MGSRDNTKRNPMTAKRANNRCVTRSYFSGCNFPIRGLLTTKQGSASTEFAFILGFIALLALTSFVVLEDGLTDSYTGLSQQVESATVNMPNPLGGG